eukprot:237832_1
MEHCQIDDSRDSNESLDIETDIGESSCTFIRHNCLNYCKNSADWDDAFLFLILIASLNTWMSSKNYLHHNAKFFVEYNTATMWIHFCFAVIILLNTLTRLSWKVFMRNKYKYDATTTIRKISFMVRCLLSVSIGVLLNGGDMDMLKMGTHKMMHICNILTMADFTSWVIDCCLHWILYGFPRIFGVFRCKQENEDDDSGRIYMPIPIQPRV